MWTPALQHEAYIGKALGTTLATGCAAAETQIPSTKVHFAATFGCAARIGSTPVRR